MSETANAIWKKVVRAADHFAHFETTLGLSGSPIDRSTTGTVEVNSDGYLEFTTNLAIPGLEHGIIIGDMVHQLRSCLDHIVYAMVKPLCADPQILRKVQFPIFNDSMKFEHSPGFHKLIQILKDTSPHIAEIRLSQPYKRNPACPTADFLWILSELNNIDKHRTILVVNPSVTVLGTISSEGDSRGFKASKQPIKAGAAVLDIGWPIPDPPGKVNVQRATQFIGLAETDGLCDGWSVYRLARGMTDAVTEVIDTFETKGLI